MAKYFDFWQKLLREFNSELDPTRPLEKTYRESGIEKIGNRRSYSGYLEIFGCDVRNHTNSQVFRDLAEVIKKNGHIKTKLTGLLRVAVDKYSILTFNYQPFSWELMMNRYRDYQDKTQMAGELYKWELVQKFQEHWNKYEAGEIEFKEFMNEIDWGNLVYHMFPPNLNGLIERKTKELEAALFKLYELEEPLQDRINDFKDELERLYEQIKGKPKDQLFLAEREIATLLTYRYPEHYTFFISSFFNPLVKALGRKNPPKWQQLSDYYQIVDEFKNEVLPKYEDAIAVKNRLTHGEEYYPDHKHLLLIQDIFYISFMKGNAVPSGEEETIETNPYPRYWLYAPGENASKWADFYSSKTMGLGWDKLGNLNQYESKEEIAQKLRQAYSGSTSKSNDAFANWQFANDLTLGDFVIAKRGRNKLLGLGQIISDYYWDEEQNDFKNRRGVKWIKKGEWKTDHSLALKTLTDITDYETEDPRFDKYFEKLLYLMDDSQDQNKPVLGKAINKILYGPPGTGKTYKLKSEYFQKYTDRETSITSAQHFEEVAKDLSWWQVVALALLENGESKVAEIKTNRWVAFKAEHSESKNLHATLWGTLQGHTVEESQTVNITKRFPPLIFDKSSKSLWKIQRDLVEEQVPELLELKDSVDNFNPNPNKLIKRYVFTTFHQSFAYEDFIEGIKPKLSGTEEEGSISYEIAEGIFKRLCGQASLDPNHRYAIFIDEINRGNIANIFGELITLIETDKRKGCENEIGLELPYSKKPFSVPANVDIYGTMNTADRSVEALDTALRRRFIFEEMMPDPALIEEELGERNNWNGFKISEILKTINQRIEVLVDRDHLIGHAYFLSLAGAEDFEQELQAIFTNKVIPLLQEYFYNDYVKIGMVLGSGFIKVTPSNNHQFAEIDDTLAAEYDDRKLYHIVPAEELDLRYALSRLMNTKQDE